MPCDVLMACRKLMCVLCATKNRWSAVVQITKISVTTCASGASYVRGNSNGRTPTRQDAAWDRGNWLMAFANQNYTHNREQKREEDGVISPSNTVVEPLAVVIAAVDAVVALTVKRRSSATGTRSNQYMTDHLAVTRPRRTVRHTCRTVFCTNTGKGERLRHVPERQGGEDSHPGTDFEIPGKGGGEGAVRG